MRLKRPWTVNSFRSASSSLEVGGKSQFGRAMYRVLLLAVVAMVAVMADPTRTVSTQQSTSHLPTALSRGDTPVQVGCPRREDIHPCECIEIPKPSTEPTMETVAFCKNIRNSQVLQNAMKGMQRHVIDFLVLDSCKLPPFPNGLLFNVGIKWMEIINSTVQMKRDFFECAGNCW